MNKSLKAALAVAALAYSLCSPFAALPAAAAPATDARLAQGIAAHNAAMAGDELSLAEALRLLGPEGWERPQLALAYHGSALTLEASYAEKAGNLAKALAFLEKGAKEIDEAVALDPSAIPVRIVRMDNSTSLIESSPADRKAEAAQDIAFLRSAWATLESGDRALVELDEGRLAIAERKAGPAMTAWRKAIREAPASPAADRARKLLARYGD
jgi:hypothetical protein